MEADRRAGAGGDLPGVTIVDGQPRLPRDPAVLVEILAEVLAATREGVVQREALIGRIRSRHGGDRARIEGLLDWLGESRVGRWRVDGALDLHPGVHVQDLAFRVAAWAAVQRVPADHQAALQRWAPEIMQQGTARADALRRTSPDPAAARAWLDADPPPEGIEDYADDDPLTARLRRILDHLDGALLERRTHVRAVLLALLAGQHALLLGPPGTAKSLLARALCSVFEDAGYFEYLLSHFTHPDELFGPVSIPGLKEEDYRRLTEGFLPQAHVAFLDEIFKANSAILNSLLTLINERVFHHGRHRDPAPLLGLIGASNELPEPDAGLDALYDRFLVRLAVPPLGDADHFLRVATGGVPIPTVPPEDRLTLDEVADLRARAGRVTIPESVQHALVALWEHARADAWPVSDRRWRQAVQLLKVAAAADGRDVVAAIDLLLLEPCLAWDPTEAPTVRATILAHLQPAAAPTHDLDVEWILLSSDRVAPTPADPLPVGDPAPDWRGRLETRRAALERFLVHHEAAVQEIGRVRLDLEHLGDRHLWLSRMPVELLEPHLEAARELARWLRRAEDHRAQIADAQSVVTGIVGHLATEDRVRPEHMQAIVAVGGGQAVGLAYRQWRRIHPPFHGVATLELEPETFLDWLDGIRSTRALIGHLPRPEFSALDGALPALHKALVPHLVPQPSPVRHGA